MHPIMQKKIKDNCIHMVNEIILIFGNTKLFNLKNCVKNHRSSQEFMNVCTTLGYGISRFREDDTISCLLLLWCLLYKTRDVFYNYIVNSGCFLQHKLVKFWKSVQRKFWRKPFTTWSLHYITVKGTKHGITALVWS